MPRSGGNGLQGGRVIEDGFAHQVFCRDEQANEQLHICKSTRRCGGDASERGTRQ